jgi:RNA polymerase sigma-70 factor (ECF subfamily)
MYTQTRTRVKKPGLQTAVKQRNSAQDQAFITLYQQYVERVYRYIFAWVGDHAAAEDLTSQVFLEALRGFSRVKKYQNQAAWLFTVARNKRVDWFRDQKRFLSIDTIPGLLAQNADLLNTLLDAERAAALRTELTLLPAHQRELLELRFAGELTYREMSGLLGKSESAVKMSVLRVLAQLRNALEAKNV